MAHKIYLLGLLFLAFVFSPSHQQASRGGGFQGGRPIIDYGPPRPFRFNYNNQDGFGATSYHQAQGDESGKVRGTYGYTDADGLYRIVEYEADVNGYRATVRTNEPGTEEKNPADVIMVVEPVPQSIISRYGGQGTQTRPRPSPPRPGGASGYGAPPPPPRNS